VPCSPPGRREQKKAATRRAIADAALRLALEHGVDGLTVDQIAAEADVAPRTFFNYFASRDDAILDVDPEATTRLVEALATRPADEPPIVALRRAALEQLDAEAIDTDDWSARMALVEAHPGLQARHAGHFAALEAALAAVVAHRCGVDPATHHYPAAVVAAAATAFRVAIQRALTDPGIGAAELVSHVFDLLETGFPPPAGSGCAGSEATDPDSLPTAHHPCHSDPSQDPPQQGEPPC
jgi:AcrR family transcriptional regulator